MPTTVRAPRVKPDILYIPDKDENYHYRWFNANPSTHGDFNLQLAEMDGWETVEKTGEVPKEVLDRAQQQVNNPGGGAVRRGDLILMRMPREKWEKTIQADIEANRLRVETTLDTMVAQSNENAAKALRDRGQKRIPANLVFREDVGDPTD